jgi:putative holliday junction resolvase
LRTLALDWGERRMGAAVSDPDGQVAVALQTVTVTGERDALDAALRLCRETEAQIVVLGLPVNMNGTQGAMARQVRRFGEALRTEAGLPVVFRDERMSSLLAERLLAQAGLHGKKRKQALDRHAARIVLESYLDDEVGRREEARCRNATE